MVDPELRQVVGALSVAERVELRDFIDLSLGPQAPLLTDEQKATVRRRAAEMETDPSVGIPWEQANAELAVEFG
jgi:putative addiction module component (TIGR02574 family)